jgi:uncharacterized protein
MNYFDTSALIKQFVEESGSMRVEALIAAEPQIATSKVAYAEVHAGLTRKWREGAMTEAIYQRTSRLFDSEWAAYIRLDLVEPLLTLTRDLLQRHPLRGFDAIHLASAIQLQQQLSEATQFVASDRRLLTAARREGLATLDVRS